MSKNVMSSRLSMFALIVLALTGLQSCGRKSERPVQPQGSGIVAQVADVKPEKPVQQTDAAKSETTAVKTNAPKLVPVQPADGEEVKKGAGDLSDFLDNMFRGPGSKEGAEILKMAKAHRNALEWSPEDWDRVRKLLTAGGDDACEVFCNEVMDRMFSLERSVMPEMASNLLALVSAMTARFYIARTLIAVEELYLWGDRYDESLKTIEMLRALPTGTSEEDKKYNELFYVTSAKDRALSLASLGKLKEVEAELETLHLLYPNIEDQDKKELQCRIASRVAYNSTDRAEVDKAMTTLREFAEDEQNRDSIRRMAQRCLKNISEKQQSVATGTNNKP